MQKYLVLLVFLVFFLFSCKENKKKENSPTNSEIAFSTKTKNDINSAVGLKHNVQNELSDENIIIVLKKIKKKNKLNDIDYSSLTTFLLKNNNEALSEEVGYFLFEYLKENKKANKDYLSFLKGKDYRENALESLIRIMCIDLGDNAYTYKRLIEDFPIFKESQFALKAFNECMSNQVP